MILRTLKAGVGDRYMVYCDCIVGGELVRVGIRLEVNKLKSEINDCARLSREGEHRITRLKKALIIEATPELQEMVKIEDNDRLQGIKFGLPSNFNAFEGNSQAL